MRPVLILLGVGLCVALCFACGNSEQTETPTPQASTTAPAEEPTEPAAEPAAEPTKAAEPEPEPAPAEPEPEIDPSKMPYDFPASTKLTAAVGDTVLSPPRPYIKSSYKNADSSAFVFYGGTVSEVGEPESKIKGPSGQEAMIPNFFIIPIPNGEKANVGDIVLTYAQKATSALSRAIVVEGGTPESPHVRYLDYELDSSTELGTVVDTLQPNTFHVLSEPWEPGQRVSCKVDNRGRDFHIIAVAGEKVLGQSASGHLKVHEKAACTPLPMRPEAKVGQKLWVTCTGGFCEATVTKVEPEIGRIHAEYDWVGSLVKVGAAYGDVSLTEP